ncbi:MAG: ATP synthase F1 subunit gamma [Lachnospiraceae bacterium]|nr:ATP synthase F1 subunit gamma [Lachnospiraceae bacterium]
MASMRDIKRRQMSVTSTQQITKAMKLVSTVKLQKAKARAERNKPYFHALYKTICSILSKTERMEHPYMMDNGSSRKAMIVITSNKGLAGGYNSNVIKEVVGTGFPVEDVDIYAVGRKGVEGLARKGYRIVEDDSEAINDPLYKDAVDITKRVLESYTKGEVGEIYMAYTNFKNTVSQEAKLIKLLPLNVDELPAEEEDDHVLMNYEPEADEALDALVPKYVGNLLYGAFIEALASENGARMQAMDSATTNADNMIADLSLKYNRARQASITQELTEIIAGSEAIS